MSQDRKYILKNLIIEEYGKYVNSSKRFPLNSKLNRKKDLVISKKGIQLKPIKAYLHKNDVYLNLNDPINKRLSILDPKEEVIFYLDDKLNFYSIDLFDKANDNDVGLQFLNNYKKNLKNPKSISINMKNIIFLDDNKIKLISKSDLNYKKTIDIPNILSNEKKYTRKEDISLDYIITDLDGLIHVFDSQNLLLYKIEEFKNKISPVLEIKKEDIVDFSFPIDEQKTSKKEENKYSDKNQITLKITHIIFGKHKQVYFLFSETDKSRSWIKPVKILKYNKNKDPKSNYLYSFSKNYKFSDKVGKKYKNFDFKLTENDTFIFFYEDLTNLVEFSEKNEEQVNFTKIKNNLNNLFSTPANIHLSQNVDSSYLIFDDSTIEFEIDHDNSFFIEYPGFINFNLLNRGDKDYYLFIIHSNSGSQHNTINSYKLSRFMATDVYKTENDAESVSYETIFDSGILGLEWYRIIIEGDFPKDTYLKSYCYAYDEIPLNSQKWFISPDNSKDFLILDAKGRKLRLKIMLKSNNKLFSPIIHSIKVYYPANPLVQYLPSIYKEDKSNNNLLSRFLSIFDTSYSQIDEILLSFTSFLDPKKSSSNPKSDFLRWLSSFMSISIDEKWSESSVRLLISELHRLYPIRGTKKGLELLIAIYLYGNLLYQKENSQHFYGSIGDNIVDQGIYSKSKTSFTIYEFSDLHKFKKNFIEKTNNATSNKLFSLIHDPFLFYVLIDSTVLGNDKETQKNTIEATKRIIREEKPAHTHGYLITISKNFYNAVLFGSEFDTNYLVLRKSQLGNKNNSFLYSGKENMEQKDKYFIPIEDMIHIL